MNKLDDIKTGDLLLFARKDIIGKWMRSVACTRWTHVALAVRLTGTKDDYQIVQSGGQLFVLEMIQDDYDYDFLTESYKNDFRLTPIEMRMRKDYSLICYRSFTPGISKKQLRKTWKFIQEHKDSKFFKNDFSLFSVWLGTNGSEDEYCCTTIVSKYLNQVLGIPICRNAIPTTFDSQEPDSEGRILCQYYSIEKDIYINHEEWHESIGLLLTFLIVWLIFWWLTADYIFKR